MTNAADFLQAGIEHMKDRASTYDKPEGERSMGRTVAMFNAVTDLGMSEEQGWLFLLCLKAVRSQQGAYRADNYEDGAAYFGLMGETAARDRAGMGAAGDSCQANYASEANFGQTPCHDNDYRLTREQRTVFEESLDLLGPIKLMGLHGDMGYSSVIDIPSDFIPEYIQRCRDAVANWLTEPTFNKVEKAFKRLAERDEETSKHLMKVFMINALPELSPSRYGVFMQRCVELARMAEQAAGDVDHRSV